ncbi:uncharacterized protein LOC101852239 isoform X2 [Aplysia californica]|nr:uncharacterized protein LOC101852239 isoform X2 [Aplysia californica]
MNEKFDILFNEISRLKEALTTGGQPCENQESVSHQFLEIPAPSIIVLSAKREVSLRKIKFTVTYKLSVDVVPDVSWFRNDEQGSGLDDVVDKRVDIGDGYVRETSAVTDSDRGYANVFVRLAEPTFGEVVLELRNSLRTNTTELSVPGSMLTLIPVPAGDITYNPGHNAKVRVIIPRVNDDSESGSTLKLNTILYDDVSRELKYGEGTGDFVQYADTKDFIETQEMELLLSTSNGSPRGLLVFTNTIRTRTRSDLIAGGHVVTQRVLRPSNETLPFPEGYLGFLRMPRSSHDPNVTVTKCNYADRGCEISCSVFGNNVTDFPIYRIGENGSRRVIPYNTSTLYGGYSVKSHAVVKPNPRGAGQVTYECVAKDADDNTASTYNVVNFYLPLKFDSEASGLWFTDPHTMMVSCVVRVAPITGVQFNFNTKLDSGWRFGEDPDSVEIIPDGLNATKVITIDPKSGHFEHEICEAMQPIEDSGYNLRVVLRLQPS